MNTDCLFCKIVSGNIPAEKVYEDAGTLAFLDIHPVNPGHALVVPKAHSQNMLSAKVEDMCAVISAILLIAPKILKAVGAVDFNLGQNNGGSAGQVVPHTHFHIIPRFGNDGHKHWRGKDTTKEELADVGNKIRASL